MSNKEKMKNIFQKLLRTVTAHTTMQFLAFVFISFLFWAFLSLNNNMQYDIEMPIKIIDIPDSSTIISDVPEYVSVNVKDKGISLLKVIVGKKPTLNIKFKDYAMADGEFFMPNAELRRKIRGVFENSTTIQGMSLDDLQLTYTNLPGKKVPVRLDLDIRPNIKYIIYGAISQDVDSVLVFSDRNTLADLEEVYTYRVEERELTDTLLRTVAIAPIAGAKIVPERVNLSIPVEPLISKKINIPIRVKNTPVDENVITFPSIVQASFLVPLSQYRKNYLFEAVADYRDIAYTSNNKIVVKVDESPALYSSISLAQDSVEFIIEKH